MCAIEPVFLLAMLVLSLHALLCTQLPWDWLGADKGAGVSGAATTPRLSTTRDDNQPATPKGGDGEWDLQAECQQQHHSMAHRWQQGGRVQPAVRSLQELPLPWGSARTRDASWSREPPP